MMRRGAFPDSGARWLSGSMPDLQSREPGFESPFTTISKFGHFRSPHDAPAHSDVFINEYLAIDGGGNVSDLVFARNCCMARILPRRSRVCIGMNRSVRG